MSLYLCQTFTLLVNLHHLISMLDMNYPYFVVKLKISCLQKNKFLKNHQIYHLLMKYMTFVCNLNRNLMVKPNCHQVHHQEFNVRCFHQEFHVRLFFSWWGWNSFYLKLAFFLFQPFKVSKSLRLFYLWSLKDFTFLFNSNVFSKMLYV